MVSHEIESGGQSFSGGKSAGGETSTGLHFEITLLQMYSVALSAGKGTYVKFWKDFILLF